jgi:two-component sensor histidine kinase
VIHFDIKGPEVLLTPKHALALALALRELCTNAAKYGALSNDEGRVRIEWTIAGTDGARALDRKGWAAGRAATAAWLRISSERARLGLGPRRRCADRFCRE